MKLEEALKASRYIREHIDLAVNEEGYVILPAGQFALFVKTYENHRDSTLMLLGMFLLIAVWFVIYGMMVR